MRSQLGREGEGLNVVLSGILGRFVFEKNLMYGVLKK